jgi:hypothetical protein
MEQLNRVALNLNQAIVEFWAKRVAAEEPRFTSTELRQHVQHYNYGTAPASADRVLRMLRTKGLVNYAVINRGKSLYLALPLEINKRGVL